jgi:glucan phosphorylase
MQSDKLTACFSMEIALNPAMPTYSGGLGGCSRKVVSPNKL